MFFKDKTNNKTNTNFRRLFNTKAIHVREYIFLQKQINEC